MEKNNNMNFDLFIDCGAPSLYNKLSRGRQKNYSGTMGTSFKERKYDDYSYVDLPEYKEYRQDYIEFMLRNKKHVKVYSNLDVINNPKLTYRNQRILEDAGLHPIPVFHLGNDVKWLKKYLDRYEYIALGGLVPNPTTVLIPILDELFNKYLVDENGFPRVKLHGFACTSLPLMIRYPWYSVDSATSRKLANFGRILLPEHGTGKLKKVLISARDVPLVHKVSPGILREIDRRAKKWKTNTKLLSESSIERAVWNHLTFLESIDNYIPQFPWSIKTRRTSIMKEGRIESLNLYFAGALSKSEAFYFWNRLEELEIPNARKHRLMSFFYKTEAVFNITEKIKNESK